MKYKFISDSHTHSENSFDGKDSVIMLADRAYNLGLHSITVTDHCECNEYAQHNYHSDIVNSVMDVVKAKALYSGKMEVYKGIELGQATQNKAAAEDALSITDYDFVLGSLHNLKGEQDFYFLEYTPENYHGLLCRYFSELMELVEYGCFDSLAHLTYPFRYIVGNGMITFDIRFYQDMIDEVLKKLIEKEKALEINTSGLRQIIGTTLPDENIIKRFHELGGKYVTLGSDAHRWGDVGAGIEDGLRIMLRCGYTHFTVYEKREPKLLPIL